jgi:hypothetical protein
MKHGLESNFVFHVADTRQREQIERELLSSGYQVRTINGDTITDRVTLFRAFRASGAWEDCGPIVSAKWDSFIDSLTSGLQDYESDRVALIWKDAGRVINQLTLFLETVEILTCAAAYLQSDSAGVTRKVRLKVVLLIDDVTTLR